jgi:hypothetical protein
MSTEMLPALVNGTGSRRLHVVAPFLPKHGFNSVRALTEQTARILLNAKPAARDAGLCKWKQRVPPAPVPNALHARDGVDLAPNRYQPQYGLMHTLNLPDEVCGGRQETPIDKMTAFKHLAFRASFGVR